MVRWVCLVASVYFLFGETVHVISLYPINFLITVNVNLPILQVLKKSFSYKRLKVINKYKEGQGAIQLKAD